MEIFAQVLTKKKARMKLKKEKNIHASIRKEESMDQGFNESQLDELCGSWYLLLRLQIGGHKRI